MNTPDARLDAPDDIAEFEARLETALENGDNESIIFEWSDNLDLQQNVRPTLARKVRDIYTGQNGISYGHAERLARRQTPASVPVSSDGGDVADQRTVMPELSEGRSGPHNNVDNAARIIAAQFGNRLCFDTFSSDVLLDGAALTDGDMRATQIHMQRMTPLHRISKSDTSEAMKFVAEANRINIAEKSLLSGPPWDGDERVKFFMTDIFDAPSDAYHEAVSRYFWLSLVERTRNPGSQVDMMVVLEGAQGIGKSRAARIIGGSYYTEAIAHDFGSRDMLLTIRGKLICELSELASLRKREIEHIKATLTARHDEYRAPYAERPQIIPRTAIFVGTTNSNDWQADDTGGRRFLPVKCKTARPDLVAQYREQYFAEALHLHTQTGADWWRQFGDSEWCTAQELRDERRARDPWEHDIDEWLHAVGTGLRPRNGEVTTADVLNALGVKTERKTRADEKRVGDILRLLGGIRTRARRDGRRAYVYTFAPTDPHDGSNVPNDPNCP